MLTKTNTRESAYSVIIKAGLLAGILDISAAFIQYAIVTSKNPLGVLNFIASGVFGKSAFAGGPAMALWGFVFHMTIAMGFAVLFFVLCLKINWCYKNKWAAALLYGIVVWLIMNMIVVPQSKAPHIPFRPAKALLAAAILIVCIGAPLSLVIGNYFRKRTAVADAKTG